MGAEAQLCDTQRRQVCLTLNYFSELIRHGKEGRKAMYDIRFMVN